MMSNKPTHFENESGHVVRTNQYLERDYRLLGLKPLYIYDAEPEKAKQPSKDMTVKELKAMCKERGITGYSTMNEAELITALQLEG